MQSGCTALMMTVVSDLMMALRINRDKLASLLIEKGANLDIQDEV